MRDSMPLVLMRMATVLASGRSVCPGGFTGCILADAEGRILATGYNGPPHGWNDNLKECVRDKLELHGGVGYEVCPCVHAEANALAHAARHGVAVKDAIAYCTRLPCASCAKSLIQAGIRTVATWKTGPKGGDSLEQGTPLPADDTVVQHDLEEVLRKRIESAVADFGEDA